MQSVCVGNVQRTVNQSHESTYAQQVFSRNYHNYLPIKIDCISSLISKHKLFFWSLKVFDLFIHSVKRLTSLQAQTKETLVGCVLRINPTSSPPPSLSPLPIKNSQSKQNSVQSLYGNYSTCSTVASIYRFLIMKEINDRTNNEIKVNN